jgi:hypothetical protein
MGWPRKGLGSQNNLTCYRAVTSNVNEKSCLTGRNRTCASSGRTSSLYARLETLSRAVSRTVKQT